MKYHWMVQHKDKLQLGYKSDIGAFTYINAKYGVTIGDFVQIGSHCSIYSVSTIDDKTGPVVLEKYCRIGSHSTIMPGVTPEKQRQKLFHGAGGGRECGGWGASFCESGCSGGWFGCWGAG